jgi:predicted DNA-binding WGR domain protein
MGEKFSLGLRIKRIERKDTDSIYLEHTTDGHNKFYNMHIIDSITDKEFPFIVATEFGKIGSNGSVVRSKLKTKGDANKYISMRMDQKLNKGYKRVNKPSRLSHIIPF